MTKDASSKSTPELLEGELVDKEIKDVAQGVPEETLKRIVHVTKSKVEWSGPLPPPHIFKQYPVAVQKAMVAQANAQMKHRHKIENKVITSNIKNSGQGMKYAFIITAGLAVIGAFLVAIGKSTAGLIAIFGPSGFQGGNYLIQKWQEFRKVSTRSKEENERHAKGEEDTDS
jgi:uncharacterized membrane protein